MSIKRNVLMLGAILQVANANAEVELSTIMADQIEASLPGTSGWSSCVDVEVKGVCLWLKCSWSGCSVQTSTVVEHGAPIATIRAFRTDNETISAVDALDNAISNPVADSLMGMVIRSFTGNDPEMPVGGGTPGTVLTVDGDIKAGGGDLFYDVSAVGNAAAVTTEPVLASMVALMGLGGYCGIPTTPFMPLMNTRIITEWRTGIWEYPASAIKFGFNSVTGAIAGGEWGALRHISTGSGFEEHTLGSVYPRTGSVPALSPIHSAQLATIKAMDLATNDNVLDGNPLAFNPYFGIPERSSIDGMNYVVGPHIKEEDSGVASYQLHLPEGFAEECSSLPDQRIKMDSLATDLAQVEPDFQSDKSHTDDTVWTLWHRYKCCVDRGNFIAKIEW